LATLLLAVPEIVRVPVLDKEDDDTVALPVPLLATAAIENEAPEPAGVILIDAVPVIGVLPPAIGSLLGGCDENETFTTFRVKAFDPETE
jgi:hypothetical protein